MRWAMGAVRRCVGGVWGCVGILDIGGGGGEYKLLGW